MISAKKLNIQIKKPHLTAYQENIVDSPKRFTITEASTKSGKTFSHIWWLFREAHGELAQYGRRWWWIAPVFKQAEIAFYRIHKKIKDSAYYHSNISKLEITTPLNTIICFKSGENPDSLYGEDVYGAVIDEGSRLREEAWHAVRSTLVATNAPCKLIGNVVGIDNWFYQIARKAEAGELDTWEYFRITAEDAIQAGIIKREEVEDARSIYPEGIFLELFYAIPFVNSSNKFAFAYNPSKHVGETTYNPEYPLYAVFDFNRNPICCNLFQHYNNRIFGIETIKLINSNIYSLCDHVKNKYPKALIIVNGDATGQAGSALVKDNLNYYKVIRSQLNLSQSQIKIPTVNPTIAENQVLVNAILEHYPLTLDKTRCHPLIYDLQFVEMLPDGTIKKGDREDPKQQADSLDTLRYYLNSNFKWFLKQVF